MSEFVDPFREEPDVPVEEPAPEREEDPEPPPSLVYASELLPPVEEETPPLPGESGMSAPPGEETGPFLIETPKGFGHGARIMFIHEDGVMEPLGIWLEREHESLDGPSLATLLKDMGLPPEHARWFGKRRDRYLREAVPARQHPALKTLAAQEKQHAETKKIATKAFIEAMKAKAKKEKQ